MRRNKDPLFWAARRLHRSLYPSPHVDDLAERAEAVIDQQRTLEPLVRMLRTAISRGWSNAAAATRERLLSQAARVQGACAELGRGQGGRRLRPASIPELAADLRQLEDEFDRVQILPRERQVAVTTAPVTLEGVDLGRFAIRLDLARLVTRRDASAFTIVAESPNPAGGSGDTTHPHVSGESLCAGDATVPIAAALAEGRVADAFILVSAVLNTYNAQSAYVQLSEWEGAGCGDCGRSISSDDLCYCEACGGDFRSSCIGGCGRCDRSLCLSCMDEDADGEPVCGHCARECRQCGAATEAGRLRRQEGLCDGCLAEREPDDEEDDDDDDDEVANHVEEGGPDNDDTTDEVGGGVAAAAADDPPNPATTTEHVHEPPPDERCSVRGENGDDAGCGVDDPRGETADVPGVAEPGEPVPRGPGYSMPVGG